MRLLLLLVFLPLILLLVGPFLVAAALFKRMPFFGIVRLEPGKHHRRGRLWVFVIGLLVWGLTWGASAFFLLPQIPASTPALAALTNRAATITPTVQIDLPSATPTATILPPTEAPAATPTPILLITFTPTLQPPTASPTTTPVLIPTHTATLVLSPTPTPAMTLTPTPMVSASITSAQETALLQSLVRANNLLVSVIENPGTDDSTRLEALWQDEALKSIIDFTRTIDRKYQLPLQVSYSTVGIPLVEVDSTGETVSIESREHWIFEDTQEKREVLNAYNYVLRQKEGRWVIISYRFEFIPFTVTEK